MTESEILAIDHQTNHSMDTLEKYTHEYNQLAKRGYTLDRVNNTLIWHKPVNQNDRMIIVFNADTPIKLSRNIYDWAMAQEGLHRVIAKLMKPKIATIGNRLIGGYGTFTGRTWIVDVAAYKRDNSL